MSISKLILSTALFSLTAVGGGAITLQSPAVSAPSLGAITLIHDKSGFSVLEDGQKHVVQQHNMDKELRTMEPAVLKAWLNNGGYIVVDRSCNGDFKLQAQGRLYSCRDCCECHFN